MTGAQLKALRTERDWTLRKMAETIGDVSFTTIRLWESDENAARELPSWVSDRLFRSMPIQLPLEELHALLDYAREEGKTPEAIFTDALREHAQTRLAPAPPTPYLRDPAAEADKPGLRAADEEPPVT